MCRPIRCRLVVCLPLAVSGLSHGQTGDVADCQEEQLFPAIIEALAHIGDAVDVDGNFAVVGQRYRATVFERSDGQWKPVATLEPPVEDGHFGWSVAIRGETVIVGAPRDDTWGEDAGAAYAFERQGGAWNLTAVIAPAWFDPDRGLGRQVALDGDTVALSTGLQNSHPGGSNAVYIFDRNEGGPNAWGLVATSVEPPNDYAGAYAGDIAIAGDRIAVGDHRNSELGEDVGAVYVLARHQGEPNGWGIAAKLLPAESVGCDRFGYTVALDEQTLLISRIPCGPATNAVDVFVQPDPDDPSYWKHLTRLEAPDEGKNNSFGADVAIKGDVAVVGAPNADTVVLESGAAYLYRRDPDALSQWYFGGKMMMSNPYSGSKFADDIAISDGTLVAGDELDEGAGHLTGAAYVFDITISDCNCNGIPDDEDVSSGGFPDCNNNGIPDACDIASGLVQDCNANAVPDVCEGEDCNNNGVLDSCELADSVSLDCNSNGIPDECEFAYFLDDGTADFYENADYEYFFWLNQFVVEPGRETIGAIAVCWKHMFSGVEATLLLYTDPNNDGDPADAVLVAHRKVLSTRTGSRTFAIEPIGPVPVGEPGDVFFVGVMGMSCTGGWAGCNVAAYEMDPAYGGASWFAMDLDDPNIENLAENDTPPERFVWDWLLRAIAVDYPVCSLGDVNVDGIVDIEDLTLVLGQWGSCLASPPTCHADLNDDFVVDAADLAIVIGNWG